MSQWQGDHPVPYTKSRDGPEMAGRLCSKYALLGGCACNPTGRKWAPINEMRLILWCTSFRILDRRNENGKTSALKVRHLIESSWAGVEPALNSGGALQSELCLITRDYGIPGILGWLGRLSSPLPRNPGTILHGMPK
jgi:hypothetical protein